MRANAPLTEGPIAATLVRLAIPIVLSNILQSAYNLTDTFWVGRLNAEAVAAVSLSFPINFLLIALGGGLPIAGSVLIAQYKGRGDQQAMNHVAAQTLIMVLVVSLTISAGGFFLSGPIMQLMGAEPEVLPDATRFLQVTFLGFVFVFGYFVFQSLMRGLGEVRLPMWIVLLTVLLNLALDPLFIFGWGPLPPLGVAGAALATLCTQALAATIGFAVLFRGRHGIQLVWSELRPDFGFMRRVFRLGLPASIEQATRALGLTVMMILVAGFGTVPVAAYGIGMRILTFVIIPAFGLSIASSTLVGQNIGADKIDRASRTNLVGCLIAFSSLTVAGAILFVLAEPCARFIVPGEGRVIALSSRFIETMSLTFGFIGLQQVIGGTLRGAGKTLAAMVLAIVSQWVIQFPLAYVLSRDRLLGLDGIWWSFAIANVLAAAVTVAWFLRGDWKRERLLDEVKLQEQVRDEVTIDEGLSR